MYIFSISVFFKTSIPFTEVTEAINKISKQPILVLLESNQIFLKLDSHYIEIKEGLVNAIDILFKAFWTFNIQYPVAAMNVFRFLEIVFKMDVRPQPKLLEKYELISRCEPTAI